MPITVPMQAPGAKSFPAEMKVGGGGNPWARMRAEHPGYGERTRTGWTNGMRPGMRGMEAWPIQTGAQNPLVLNPLVAMYRRVTGMSGLGDGDTGTTDVGTFVSNDPSVDPTLNIPDTTPLPTGTDLMAGLNSIAPQIPDWTGPTILTTPTTTPPTPPSGYQWASILNASGQTIGQILAISQGGSITQLPNGLRIVQGSTPGAVQQASGGVFTASPGGLFGTAGVSSTMLLVVGAAVLLMMTSRR